MNMKAATAALCQILALEKVHIALNQEPWVQGWQVRQGGTIYSACAVQSQDPAFI